MAHVSLFGDLSCKSLLLHLRYTRMYSRQLVWVAVKEFELSYYIGETLLFTIYTRYGNLM